MKDLVIVLEYDKKHPIEAFQRRVWIYGTFKSSDTITKLALYKYIVQPPLEYDLSI
jgi:hypothetical protein